MMGVLLKIGILDMKGPKFSGGQYYKTWELQKLLILKTFYEGIICKLKDSS